MNKFAKILTLTLFFGMLIIFPIITIFNSNKSVSPKENKTLSDFPELTKETFFNKSYVNGIDNFVSDHFTARKKLISLKTNMDIVSGKKEVNNIFILKDRLIKRFSEPNYEKVSDNINAINLFSQRIDKDVYVMIAPTAAGVYEDHLPKYAKVYNQKTFIDYVYNYLNKDNVVTLDVFNPLFSTREEYIYYRTDHNWTSLGAYYAYSSTIKKMGFVPISLNSFDIEHASNDFKGTLYSKILYNNIKSDTLDFYHYKKGYNVTSVVVGRGKDAKVSDSMYFKEYLNNNNKYSAMLGEEAPIVTITTDEPSGKNILVIKDSYANSLVPYLTQHYSEITMVDLRYLDYSLETFVDINYYDQVLFLYNAESFSTYDYFDKLNQ